MNSLKIYLTLVAIFSLCFTYSQNLILDGSLEGGAGGTATVPPDWTIVQHSPDNCASPPAACPGPSYVINNPSPDGGRWQRFFRGGGWNERFGQYFCQPLVAGQTYTLEFWASHSALNSSTTATTTGIDFGFSNGLPGGTGAGAGNAGSVNLNTPENWQLVSVTFVAAGNYDFLSFAKNTTDTQNAAYIDGVSLVSATPSGGDPGTDGTLSVCSTDPAVNLFDYLGGTPDNGGTWSGPSALSGGDLGTYDPGANATGVYTYEVSTSGPCVTGTASATVTVSAGSADATISAAGPFCDNDAPIILSAVDAGGTWSGTGIVNPSTGEFDPSIAGSGSHTVTYTISGACSDTDTENITINPSSDATITGVGPLCESDASILLNAVDPGGTWSGTGITNSSTGEFDPGTAGPGTHTIMYTIGGLCGDVQTTDITVNSQFDATITPVGPFCESDPMINLTAVDPGGSWAGTGITNVSTGEFDPTVAGVGTHTITYTIAGSCGDVQTTDITVSNVSDATISAAGPFCDSDPAVTLVGVDAGGTWSGIGIINATTGEFDPGTAGPGTHTITYTIPGTCGDVQTTDITVGLQLDATITPVGPFCENDPVINLTAVDPGGTWLGTGITNATTGEFDPAVVGTHTITYTVPGACGDVETTDVIVNSLADATVNTAGPFCENDASINLTAVNPGGTWSGTGITDATTGAFNPSGAGPGTHTITYTISGQCGASNTEDIVVNALDDATINPAGPFCLNNNVQVLSAVTAGGTWSGTGITDANSGEFTPSAAGEGIFTITYTTAGLCPNSSSIDVEVLGPLNITAFQDETICEGESVNLSASGSGGDSNLSTVWTDDLGNTISSVPNVTVSPLVTTTYIATLSDGCNTIPATDQVTVTVYPLPQIDFSATDYEGCLPFTAHFINSSMPSGTNCTWDFGDGNLSTDCGNVSNVYTNPGCYDVTLTVSENGCTNTGTIPSMICVYEYAEAGFTMTPSVEMNIENTLVEFTNESINADSYEWSFGDGVSSMVENPIHEFPHEPGNFQICLKAINPGGCNDSICRIISVTEDLIFYIPNAMTPDGDQFNEAFKPIFTSGFDPYDFHFTIFNRWGEVIWESYDATKGWNGHYGNGGFVEDGVYIWQVEFKSSQSDERHLERGHVTVLK